MKHSVTLSEALAVLNSEGNRGLREGTTDFTPRAVVRQVLRRLFDLEPGELTLREGRVFTEHPNGTEPYDSAYVIRNGEAWFSEYMGLRKFVETHNFQPREGGSEDGESEMWGWCNRQRGLKVHGELSSTLVEGLEKIPGWTW